MLIWLSIGIAAIVLGGIVLATRRRRPGGGAAPDQPSPDRFPDAAEPKRLVIRLPKKRDRYGSLTLHDAAGGVIEGPFAAIGRAGSVVAREAGNPDRLPTRPFGDTPLGIYRLRRLEPAPTSPKSLASHGPHGRLILAPVSGDAALAEAAGRLEFAVQGGSLGPNGALRATDGAIRVHDTTIWILLDALRGREGLACEIIRTGGETTSVVEAQEDEFWAYDDGGVIDPPWPDLGAPQGGYTPDIPPALTGAPTPGEQLAAVAVAEQAAAEASEAAAGVDNSYAP
jgi:hypothetical protein